MKLMGLGAAFGGWASVMLGFSDPQPAVAATVGVALTYLGYLLEEWE